MKKTYTIIILILVVLIAGIVITKSSRNEHYKIGVISPLTGDVAFWGESTMVGIELAKQELAGEGVRVDIIIEDGQLDPGVALGAAQKLVNIDRVTAVFSEFNPAAISVSSFLSDTDVVHLYNAAVESPLNENELTFKTYLDFRESCKEVAVHLKDVKQIESVGLLKMNLEFSDLCFDGIQEIYGNNILIESYNPGETDFKTLLLKLNRPDIGAIFHPAFKSETVTSIRNMNELGIDKIFVGLRENITPDVVSEMGELIENNIFFGLPVVSEELKSNIRAANNGLDVPDYNAAALGYLHIKQLANAIDSCGGNSRCISETLVDAEPDADVGFLGFESRIAKFNTDITEFIDDRFVEVK